MPPCFVPCSNWVSGPKWPSDFRCKIALKSTSTRYHSGLLCFIWDLIVNFSYVGTEWPMSINSLTFGWNATTPRLTTATPNGRHCPPANFRFCKVGPKWPSSTPLCMHIKSRIRKVGPKWPSSTPLFMHIKSRILKIGLKWPSSVIHVKFRICKVGPC